jgi:tRNA-splicing ligase RtcB
MQQQKKINRLIKALALQGLDVTYQDKIYTVRLQNSPDTPSAEILLPENFPVEGKALQQL